ncbi:hypothetical protein CHCC14820_1269 [Bacillus paralicheniformis]|nr:hypothetical protein CHCC14820_1269 [Bacillus paralicheniformis]
MEKIRRFSDGNADKGMVLSSGRRSETAERLNDEGTPPEYGIAGNCFDLSIWLLDEFTKDGVEAFPIGRSFKTERAHAAVIALDERGRRFLCDLGDQWLQPILIDCECEIIPVKSWTVFSRQHKFKSSRQPAELRSFTIGRTERCQLKSTLQSLLTCPFFGRRLNARKRH